MLLRWKRRSTHAYRGALVNVRCDTHSCRLGEGEARPASRLMLQLLMLYS
jgi:hypothetical protein